MNRPKKEDPFGFPVFYIDFRVEVHGESSNTHGLILMKTKRIFK